MGVAFPVRTGAISLLHFFHSVSRPQSRRFALCASLLTLTATGTVLCLPTAQAQQKGTTKKSPAPPAKKPSAKSAKPAASPTKPTLTPSPQDYTATFRSVRALKAFKARLEKEAHAREEAEEEREEQEREREEKEDRERAKKGLPPIKRDKEREKERGKEKAKESEEKEGVPDYLEAYLYDLELRAFPYDTIDTNAYINAARARSFMPTLDTSAASSKVIDRGGAISMAVPPGRIAPAAVPARQSRWTFVGPRNLPVPYNIYYGPSGSATSGRVSAIAYDATNPATVYLAAAGGGIWKSLNNGKDWFALGDTFDFLFTSSIAVHPTNGQIVYAGLGDFDGQSAAGYTGGVLKSTDGGVSWTRLGTTAANGFVTIPSTRPISGIIIDPENPQIVTVCSGRGGNYPHIYRSTDGGANWLNVDGLGTNTTGNYGDWTGLSFGSKNSTNSKRYYYSYNFQGSATALVGLYRSADQGVTWKLVPQTAFTPSYGNIARVAASPTDPDTVYVIDSNSTGIYKGVRNAATDTDDAPAYTWTNITGSYPNGYNWSQAYYYDLHITVAGGTFGGTTPKDIVYGGGITVSGSPDAGATWTDFGQTYQDTAQTHNDQHSMAINPSDPTRAMVGNDGGIYGLTYNQTQNTWALDASLSLTLGLTQIYHADWHPTDPNRMIGGAQDNATPIALGLDNATGLAKWSNVGGGDGGGSVINPLNPRYQYTTAQRAGAYGSTNNGNSFDYLYFDTTGQSPVFVTVLAVDPNANNMYLGTNYLNRYTEGVGWTYKLGNQVLGSITAISVAPGDSNRIYTGSSNGQLWMTTNGGASWTRFTSPTTRAATSISINPNDKNDILVGFSGTGGGHLYRGVVSGTTASFTNISGSGAAALPDFPLNEVSRDPNAPTSIFYTATDGGVFVTLNGGSTWANATGPLGLPNARCTAIKAVAGTGFLNVATYGRGFWRIPLVSAQTTAPNPNLTTSYTIARSGSNFVVNLTITNTGASVNNVQLNTAVLVAGGTNQVPAETLPLSFGTIATNGYVTKILTFPTGGGTAGTRTTLSLSGVYSIGTFSSALRVTLP